MAQPGRPETACVLLVPTTSAHPNEAPLDIGISISLFVLLVLEWVLCAGCLRCYRRDILGPIFDEADEIDAIETDRLMRRMAAPNAVFPPNLVTPTTTRPAQYPASDENTPSCLLLLLDCFRDDRIRRRSPPPRSTEEHGSLL